MHGRTFNTNIIGQKATLWGPSLASSPAAAYRGKCGEISAKDGIGKRGKGFVTIRFKDGFEHRTAFHNVALGDNSR